MGYYDGIREVARKMRVGRQLVLGREPSNAYDEKAIEVFMQNGCKLGYVPRVDNAI